MAFAVLPLVMLLLENCGSEPQQGIGVGEDPHHLGSAVDFGIDALDGIGRADGAVMLKGKGEIGQDLRLGLAQHRSSLGNCGLEAF